MLRRAALTLLLVAGFSWSASAEEFVNRALASTTVATGAPISATYSGPPSDGPSAYLLVTTANEVNTASLVVTVFGRNAAGTYLLCTSTAITTETTTAILLGSLAGAGEGITDACDFPLPSSLTVTLTVSGTDASFDVSAFLDSAVTGSTY